MTARDAHAPRLQHARVDAERQRLRRLHAGAVRLQVVERREVHDAGVGVAGGRDAAPTLPLTRTRAAPTRRRAPASVPLVRRDAVDPDVHAEATRVDRLRAPLGAQRSSDACDSSVTAPSRPRSGRAARRRRDEPQRRAGVLGQRGRERSGERPRAHLEPVEAQSSGSPSSTGPATSRPSEAQREPAGHGIVVGDTLISAP